MAGEVLVPVVFAMAFLVVLSPYLLNSKRVFGHFFYNVNSTFYVWYDDWPAASQGTYRHGDGVGWPKMPAGEIPSMGKYLRGHSAGQIAARIRVVGRGSGGRGLAACASGPNRGR